MLKKDLLKKYNELKEEFNLLENENKDLKTKLKKFNDQKLKAQKKYQKTEKGKMSAKAAAKRYYEKKKQKRELEKLKYLKEKYEKMFPKPDIPISDDFKELEDLTLQEQEQLDLFLENPAKYGIKPDKTADYTISVK